MANTFGKVTLRRCYKEFMPDAQQTKFAYLATKASLSIAELPPPQQFTYSRSGTSNKPHLQQAIHESDTNITDKALGTTSTQKTQFKMSRLL
jgi:hypothetical protein